MTFDSLRTKSSNVRHSVGYFFYINQDRYHLHNILMLADQSIGLTGGIDEGFECLCVPLSCEQIDWVDQAAYTPFPGDAS